MLESYKADDREYFIGSLITIEREKDRLYDVVDGQQQLATSDVILARFRANIENTQVKDALQNRLLPTDAYHRRERRTQAFSAQKKINRSF